MGPSRLVAVVGLLVAVVAAQAAPQLRFKGRLLLFTPQALPFNDGGTLFVPLRETVGQSNVVLDIQDSGRRFEMSYNRTTAEYVKGATRFRLNGSWRSLSDSSQERNTILFVPFAIFSQLTGGDLKIDRSNNNGGFGNNNNGGFGNNNNSNSGTDLYYNGRRLSFSGNEEPYSSQGTTLVPFRALGSALGLKTDRSPDGKRVWIWRNSDRIEYNKGMVWYRLNEDRRDIGAKSEEKSGVLFVPIELFKALVGRSLTTR